MRQAIKWTAVISMAVTGAFVSPRIVKSDEPPKAAAAVDQRIANPAVPALALPAGIDAKEVKDLDSIRKAFGKLTQESLTKDGFKGVTDRFVAYQRDRLNNEYTEKKDDALNAVVGRIQSQWKDKYHHDFDIDKTERTNAFSNFVILEGEISAPDQLAANWPVPQPAMTTLGTVRDDKAQVAGGKADLQQAKLEKGREVAIAGIPAAMGLPEIRTSLLREHLVGWKFEVPNTITGQQLHDNLVKRLTAIADHPDQWPSDVDSAYGLVTHHVLMAIYNVDLPAGELR